MNVHELYNLKQQQYMQYKIDKGVWDSKLNETRQKLMESITALEGSVEQIDDANIKAKIVSIIQILEGNPEQLTTDILDSAKAELDSVCLDIEQKIRQVLQ